MIMEFKAFQGYITEEFEVNLLIKNTEITALTRKKIARDHDAIFSRCDIYVGDI